MGVYTVRWVCTYVNKSYVGAWLCQSRPKGGMSMQLRWANRWVCTVKVSWKVGVSSQGRPEGGCVQSRNVG